MKKTSLALTLLLSALFCTLVCQNNSFAETLTKGSGHTFGSNEGPCARYTQGKCWMHEFTIGNSDGNYKGFCASPAYDAPNPSAHASNMVPIIDESATSNLRKIALVSPIGPLYSEFKAYGGWNQGSFTGDDYTKAAALMSYTTKTVS